MTFESGQLHYCLLTKLFEAVIVIGSKGRKPQGSEPNGRVQMLFTKEQQAQVDKALAKARAEGYAQAVVDGKEKATTTKPSGKVFILACKASDAAWVCQKGRFNTGKHLPIIGPDGEGYSTWRRVAIKAATSTLEAAIKAAMTKEDTQARALDVYGRVVKALGGN